MTEPEYATLRDLIDAVQNVDDKLDDHKLTVEKRLGRIEKGLLMVGVLAFAHPTIPVKTLPFLSGAIHTLNALSLFH